MKPGCDSGGTGPGEDHQEFPNHGELAANLDKEHAELNAKLEGKGGLVYAYILTSVKEDRDSAGGFRQEGCAPNFQGDLLTLFTCMHRMRTYPPFQPSRSQDVWVAGLTGASVDKNANYLFYLMKASRQFRSYCDAWSELGNATRKAKQADRHTRGDLFKPRTGARNHPFDPRSYYPPHPEHVHAAGQWKRDINYLRSVGKPEREEGQPRLLVGERELSFLWSRPTFRIDSMHPRLKKYQTLREFLDKL